MDISLSKYNTRYIIALNIFHSIILRFADELNGLVRQPNYSRTIAEDVSALLLSLYFLFALGGIFTLLGAVWNEENCNDENYTLDLLTLSIFYNYIPYYQKILYQPHWKFVISSISRLLCILFKSLSKRFRS